MQSGLLDFLLKIKCAFATSHGVFVPILKVRNVHEDYERNEKCSQIFAQLVGEMDCETQESRILSPLKRSRNLSTFDYPVLIRFGNWRITAAFHMQTFDILDYSAVQMEICTYYLLQRT